MLNYSINGATTLWVHDPASMLIHAGSANISYDLNRNLINRLGRSTTVTYSYDYENRPPKVTDDGQAVGRYV